MNDCQSWSYQETVIDVKRNEERYLLPTDGVVYKYSDSNSSACNFPARV